VSAEFQAQQGERGRASSATPTGRWSTSARAATPIARSPGAAGRSGEQW
jgi:hypothetical protein